MSDLTNTLRHLHAELQQAQRLGPDDIQRLLESELAGRENAGGHGDALEGAAVRLEAGHPGLAGAIRAVLDAIGKAGI
jgi:hypothetical protein